MTAEALLSKLPPPKGIENVITDKQDVRDIVREVLTAHQIFSRDYDRICDDFAGPDAEQQLFDFCKKNLAYVVESEAVQSTNSPAVLLEAGHCDCKGYAGFVAGVLDGLNRSGEGDYDWRYRFAHYGDENHVFVVVRNRDGSDTWIDPVLSELDQRYPEPDSWVDKSRPMTLVRMSGPNAVPRPSYPPSTRQPPIYATKGAGHMAGPLSAYGCCNSSVGNSFPLGTWFNPDPALDLGLSSPVPAGTVNGYGTATWIPPGYPTKTQPYLYNGRLILRPLVPITEVPLATATPYIMAALQYGITTYSSTPYSILYSNLLGSAPFRIQMQTLVGTGNPQAKGGAGKDDWLTFPPQPTGLDTFLNAASNAIPSVVAAGINALLPGLGTTLLNALNVVKPSTTSSNTLTPTLTDALSRLLQTRTAPATPAAASPAVNSSTSSGTSLLDTVTQFAEANPIPSLAIAAAVALIIAKLFSD